MDLQGRAPLALLDKHQAQRGAETLGGMPTRPQMSGDHSNRDVKVFRDLAERARHMAILTGLVPQPGPVEILAPLEERLGLLANHPLAQGVAVGTHS